jgi:hypothetical protein
MINDRGFDFCKLFNANSHRIDALSEKNIRMKRCTGSLASVLSFSKQPI